jgi:FkbM family methyltransferase
MLTQGVKQGLRALARHWRVDLVRKPRALLDRLDCQLQLGVDYAVAHTLLGRERVNLVQVGANDGRTEDPLNAVLRSKHCRGLLLEPHPQYFRQLQETYRDQPQLTLVNAAIAATDGRATLYSIRDDAPGPDWVHGLSSFSREHLLKHDGFVPEIAKYVDEIEVEALTFDTLFQRHPIEPVDVLQIDTEGFDAEVLRLFNVARRRPAIINFEHRHLSEADWNTSVESLIALGYKIAIVNQDTLACRPPE